MSEEVFIESLIKHILEWWTKNLSKWDYPWRYERDLYRSIVAEILLVRTRRSAVVNVYKKFFDAFPDPQALSSASHEEILNIVGSLGLRKRAQYLKMLGKALSKRIPKRPEDLESLPCIGEYAKDILSLKLFNKGRIPIDRNIARVLWRILRGENPTQEKPEKDPWVRTILKKFEKQLKPEEKLNLAYALMDFAYEICRPRSPRCNWCPIKKRCGYAKRKKPR